MGAEAHVLHLATLAQPVPRYCPPLPPTRYPLRQKPATAYAPPATAYAMSATPGLMSVTPHAVSALPPTPSPLLPTPCPRYSLSRRFVPGRPVAAVVRALPQVWSGLGPPHLGRGAGGAWRCSSRVYGVQRMVLYGCYAKSGTDQVYDAVPAYAMRGTDVAYGGGSCYGEPCRSTYASTVRRSRYQPTRSLRNARY
eukprot:695881-Rhodomonas_salina.2